MVTEPQIGEVLDERFAILALVGSGGMGTVFKATDLTTGRAAAIKIPFFQLESNPAFFSRFQREIEIGRKLDHPGILKTLAVDHASRPYLPMEYIEGETLWDLLQRERPLPTGEALRIVMLLCDATGYMHRQGVVHRDLKPNNVMLCRDGSVRIMDFGIATATATRRLTFAGLTGRLGTPQYMAPELVTGQRGDARTDVYSLGAILYEMATGHAPFDEQESPYAIMNARLVGDPVAPRAHDAGVTPEVEEIILHALARQPDDRYQSAEALKDDLCAPGRVHITGRAGRLKVPHVGAPHWRVALILAVALLIPVLLFFAILFMLRR